MLKFINKYNFVSILAVVFFIGCGDIDNTGENVVGDNIVNSELLSDVNASTSLSYVKAFRIDVNATSAFAYKTIKITYMTKDEKDNDVKASGVLVYPVITQAFLEYYKNATGKNFLISLIVNNHGTIFENSDSPSEEISSYTSSSNISSVLMTAKAGFAVVMPDYLGYGISNDKYHPYILKKSSAKVSIDMLSASTKYMTDNNILFNGQVYITGYSEGGYVAMAMAEEIEKNYSSTFNLKGVAPMAGPYDIESLGIKEVNASRTMEHPAFLAYLTNSYSKTYSDINLSETIVYPNVNNFNNLFTGNLSGPAINVSLGMGNGTTTFGFKSHTADNLWKISMINDFANINNTFRVRLSENNVYDWTPKAKMNLIHCADDEIIPISMAETARDKFLENGAIISNIKLTSIPSSSLSQEVDATHPFVHGNCGGKAYGTAVTWFAGIRSGDIQ